jgi:hypothetical protein
MPLGSGSYRGSLALLVAQQGELLTAHHLLETGEPHLESFPDEHARFLCKMGQVQLLGQRPDLARSSLARARAISAKLCSGESGEVAQAIAELHGLLAGPGTGHSEPATSAAAGDDEQDVP